MRLRTACSPDNYLLGYMPASCHFLLLHRCRRLEMVEPGIIGELLQPGGVRALERLDLADTITAPHVDSVVVEGWVPLYFERFFKCDPSDLFPILQVCLHHSINDQV